MILSVRAMCIMHDKFKDTAEIFMSMTGESWLKGRWPLPLAFAAKLSPACIAGVPPEIQ